MSDMIIGNPDRIAARFEPNQPITPWVWGKFCLMVRNCPVGTWEKEPSFRILTDSLIGLYKFKGMRESGLLCALPLEECHREIEGVLFDRSEPRPLDPDANYHAMLVSSPVFESFHDWRIFLVESGQCARLIWSRDGSPPQEAFLSAGEFDQMLLDSIHRLDETFQPYFDAPA